MAPGQNDSEAGAGSPKADQAGLALPQEGGDAVELAVFDFDGTCISGNSPVMLVKHLIGLKMIRGSVLLRIMLWGAAYKLRLPQSESWVRGLVFSAFEDWPKEKVDEFLFRFYDEKIDRCFRKDAEEAMLAHRACGRQVVVVSATFEPIVVRAMGSHPFCHQVSTRMRVDAHGRYTREVEGCPIEGEEKVCAIGRFADAAYGRGNWTLAYAYGDHHSDRPLLHAARHALAVTPDHPLERTAKREGWDIVDWK